MNEKLTSNSYSHAKLDVIKEKSLNYVIKTFDHDLSRVSKNILKQKQFTDKIFGNTSAISVPITEVTKQSKKISIKMPYIDGLNGSDIILYSHRSNFISFLSFVIKKIFWSALWLLYIDDINSKEINSNIFQFLEESLPARKSMFKKDKKFLIFSQQF